MAKTILTPFQQTVIRDFKRSSLADHFYLSGGTALAEFYLLHRRSEDLDFFTQDELHLDELIRFINAVGKKIPVRKIEFQHGFGLYTFFITTDKNEKHKIDFGQYPFSPIEKLKNFDGLMVESLYDIGVNKAHTIAFRPRLRDFIDLYCIFQKRPELTFQELLKRSFEKFEMRADPLQVGQNLIEVQSLVDMPYMIQKLDIAKVRVFFLKEARKLTKSILKK
jgi:predicted nucleotidyltransferase component of viral defense system